MPIEISQAIESSADAIFQHHTLHDITDLSQTLSHAASSKHNELRNLVASQYRDLLKTADQIISMNELSKRADRNLYDLSFVSSPRLVRNIGIEANVTRWIPDREVSVVDKAGRVQKKADMFLEMSKLLNLSSRDSMREIQDVLESLPTDEEWFKGKREVVDEKLMELEMVVLEKIEGMSLEELIAVDEFVERSMWFDRCKVENKVYEVVVRLVTMDNLKFVLQKFEKFAARLGEKYKTTVESIIADIALLMETIQEKGIKLDLYALDLDNDYLDKIRFISNGLVFQKYQRIATDINTALETLNYLETINSDLYQNFKTKINTFVEQFKAHAMEEDNRELVKYLESLV